MNRVLSTSSWRRGARQERFEPGTANFVFFAFDRDSWCCDRSAQNFDRSTRDSVRGTVRQFNRREWSVIAQTRTSICRIWSARNDPDGQDFYPPAAFCTGNGRLD
jgi:hypothetical protein